MHKLIERKRAALKALVAAMETETKDQIKVRLAYLGQLDGRIQQEALK